MKKYKNCQSCYMPLKKDPKNGGTENDGSKSKMYCSYCYENGEFLQPEFSAKDMQIFCKNKMKKMGIPGIFATLFTKKIPKLERWKNKNTTKDSKS